MKCPSRTGVLEGESGTRYHSYVGFEPLWTPLCRKRLKLLRLLRRRPPLHLDEFIPLGRAPDAQSMVRA
jgi:hypothetical protein